MTVRTKEEMQRELEHKILIEEVQKSLQQSCIALVVMFSFLVIFMVLSSLETPRQIPPIYVNGSMVLLFGGIAVVNIWLFHCRKESRKVFENLAKEENRSVEN